MNNTVSVEVHEKLKEKLKNAEDKLKRFNRLYEENGVLIRCPLVIQNTMTAYKDTISILTTETANNLKTIDKLLSDLACKQKKIDGRQESINMLQEKVKKYELGGNKEQQDTIEGLKSYINVIQNENSKLQVVVDALINSAVNNKNTKGEYYE